MTVRLRLMGLFLNMKWRLKALFVICFIAALILTAIFSYGTGWVYHG